MKTISVLSALVALTALPQVVQAAAPDFYISGAGGLTILPDARTGAIAGHNTSFDNGWDADLAIGHRYYNGLRGELELNYQNNESRGISGHVSSEGVMANGFYDFLQDAPFSPYLGVGAGVMRLDYRNVGLNSTTAINDQAYTPALQGIAGVSYTVSPKVSVFADYRYVTTFDRQIETTNGTSVESNYGTHRIMAGVRINFGGPKPVVLHEMPAQAAPEQPQAPAVATDSVPARSYLVFFDFDKSTLTPDAEKILQEVAVSAKDTTVVRITLTGHTDTVGSAKYNQALSERRALAVKKALLALGVTNKDIVTIGKGKSDLLVPTKDGVAEPQNRRVEIVYNK